MVSANGLLFSREHFLQYQPVHLNQATINILDSIERYCSICRVREFSVDGKRITQNRINFSYDPDYDDGIDIPVRLPCGHVYGKRCIVEYFSYPNQDGSYKTHCPMCNQQLFRRGFVAVLNQQPGERMVIHESKRVIIIRALMVVAVVHLIPLLLAPYTEIRHRAYWCGKVGPKTEQIRNILAQSLEACEKPLQAILQDLESYLSPFASPL
jgi:RING-type zinc-finger